MRKYISIVLVIVLCLAFVGCGEKKTETQETEISETETSEVTDLPEEEDFFYPSIIGNGRFSLSDFEKEDADAYLNELMEPYEYGYAPATGELIIAGEIPYYMLGYSYEDTGSWIMFYTILDGMAYNFCGWRPNDTVVETAVEFLWGTASTLNSLLAELEEEVDGE